MGTELANLPDREAPWGPAMDVLTDRQRAFVVAYCEHPNFSHHQLAKIAGYAATNENVLRVCGHNLMHNEKIIAAINEEASSRLRGAGILGVSVMIAIASNPAHKDQLKAATALADRTGFHAMSEHKVTVDDKRPQTKQEMIAAIVQLGREQGMSDADIKKWTGGEIVDTDFVEVEKSIEEQMEEL